MASITSNYIKQMQSNNPEKFNKDFLELKVKDNEVMYLEAAMLSLNSIEGITYLRMEQLPHMVFDKDDIEDIDAIENQIIKSKLKLYRFYFLIEKGDRSETIYMDLYYPEMERGQYFIINSNRYFPVFQLLDSSFFNTPNAVVLRTLIMPISLEYKNETLLLNIFKKKISPFYYYLAKFGYEDTMRYFNMEDMIFLCTEKEDLKQLDEDEYHVHEVNKKLYICVDKEFFSNNKLICDAIISCFNTRTTIDRTYDIQYWKKRLGTLFSTAKNKTKKADLTLISFERALDPLNKIILRLDEDDKKDIYSILKYMIINYEHLKTRDNCDLKNKRIRSHEYLIYPLLRRFTNFVRRINNGRNITFEKLCDFRPPQKGYLIKTAVNNELLRYDNSSNSINIISKLKYSQGGVQSQFANSGVNIIYRVNNPSFIGRIGLLATSAGSPGCTGSFTPFCSLVDGHHFTEKEG